MEKKDVIFDKIYLETKAEIYRYICAKCQNLSDIDDIFQDTYVALYEYLSRHKKAVESPIALVRTICKRNLIKHYIFYSRKKESPPQEVLPPDDDSELVERVNSLIKKKSVYIQKLFFMRHSLDMSFKDIAKALGKNEGAVKQQYYKAAADIRRRLEKEEE